MKRLGTVVHACVFGLLAAVAGWWFAGVFVGGSALVPLASMVVGVTLAVVGIRFVGVPPLLVDLLVGLMAVAVVVAATAAIRSDQLVSDLTEGLVNGWARVLTTELPVAGRMDLLVAPMVVVGLATVAGQLLLLRTRSVWLPVTPLLVLVATGLAFGSGAASQPWLLVAVMVGGFCLLALLREGVPVSQGSLDERSADDQVVALPTLGGLAALSGAVALAVALTGPTPLRNEADPFTLRRYVTPEQDDLRLASPLSRAEELVGVERVMTVQALNAIPAGTRVRVASLETYDGLGWSPADRLEPVGSEMPGLARSGTQLEVIVTPQELDLPWIPTVGEPLAARSMKDGAGTVLLWSPISGNLATSDLSSSDGVPWQVSAVAPAPAADQLVSARLANGLPLNLGERNQNEVVKELRERAEKIVGADKGSFAAALRLLAFFQNEPTINKGDAFAVDPQAASSPALGGVTRFVDGRVGNRFQFATSYAAMAQLAGIPARVAVGVELEKAVGKGSSVEVSGAELSAWPEVNVSGLGWLPLDPIPDEEGSATGAVEEQLDEAVDEAVASDPDELPPPDDPAINPDPDSTDSDDGADSKLWMVVLGSLALIVGLVAAPTLRLVRRRRRQQGSPTQRIGGAWAELMDVFVEEGESRPLSATPSETVELLGGSLDDDGVASLHALAGLVELATFSPSEPTSGDADRAWTLLSGIRKGLDRSPIRRAQAGLSPAPLAHSASRGSANAGRGIVSDVAR